MTLEAEIKELEKAIEDEENMRDKEHADYLAAKDELDKSVAALQGAVTTMGDATTDMKEGVFLTSMHTKMQKVVKVGEGFLAASDVQRLRKVLEVPDADWNELNRDATFKMKYKQRSGEIQEILGEMLTTFTDNRNEAVAAESKAVEDFTALMSSKNDQLTTAKDALLAKAGENGARGASLAESNAEKTELETQNSNDEKFISQTKASCETKASEWSERKRLRTEEQASIQQAIATLTSDDARDLFKRSFDSQGATFLQTHLKAVRKHGAGKVEKGKQTPTDFSAVTKDLEDMIADLVKEEKDDATEKEMCETERAKNNIKLHKLAKQIDTNTEIVDRLNKQIAAANKRIEESDDEIADLNKAQQDADDQRAKEAGEYASAKADDKKAIEVLGTSMKVLQDFYTNNGLSFVQAPGEGGEAPTAPPTTWGSDGYGGASAETGGVIAMMENVKDDMKKDIKKADQDESDAIAAHAALTADITQSIKDLESTKGTLNGAIAADESSKSGEQTTRATNEDTSAAALTFLKSIANGCDYMMKNFEERKSNRQAEMDGLSKAKAIFAGADFS